MSNASNISNAPNVSAKDKPKANVIYAVRVNYGDCNGFSMWTQTYSSIASAVEAIKGDFWENLLMVNDDPTEMWERAAKNIKTKKDLTTLSVLVNPDDEDPELCAEIQQLNLPTS